MWPSSQRIMPTRGLLGKKIFRVLDRTWGLALTTIGKTSRPFTTIVLGQNLSTCFADRVAASAAFQFEFTPPSDGGNGPANSSKGQYGHRRATVTVPPL